MPCSFRLQCDEALCFRIRRIPNPDDPEFRVSPLPPRPVAAVLVEKRQRLERLHPVEEEDAVEMIGLVLDDA